MVDGPAVVTPPKDGLWRVARGANPLAVPIGDSSARGGNRFDPLTMTYGVLYFGSDLETCFAETLARFRPSMAMLALVKDEWEDLGFMAVGSVAADWRQRRTAIHIQLPADLVFLDVES